MVKLSRLKNKFRKRTHEALNKIANNAIILFLVKIFGIIVSIISIIVLIIVNLPNN